MHPLNSVWFIISLTENTGVCLVQKYSKSLPPVSCPTNQKAAYGLLHFTRVGERADGAGLSSDRVDTSPAQKWDLGLTQRMYFPSDLFVAFNVSTLFQCWARGESTALTLFWFSKIFLCYFLSLFGIKASQRPPPRPPRPVPPRLWSSQLFSPNQWQGLL